MLRPQEFFSLAQELADNSTEVHWRSAISRAYYGVFHITRDRVSRRTNVTKGKDVHKFLKDYLSNNANRTLGQNLGDLHNQRKQADYDIGIKCRTFTKRDAETQLKLALKLASNVRNAI